MPRLSLPIVGNKTTLRPMSSGDCADWYAVESDPKVRRFVGGPVTTPQAEWIEQARAALPERLPLAVIANASGRFAGRASLDPRKNMEWEITVVIAKAYWGKDFRFGREVSEMLIRAAFRNMKASAVIAVVDPENKASRKLVAELGFEQVGEVTSDDFKPEWQKGHLKFRLQHRK